MADPEAQSTGAEAQVETVEGKESLLDSILSKVEVGAPSEKVNLNFDSMKAFNPDQVARQIPELSKLLAARNLLQDLRNRLISMGDFRRQLETVVKDEALREKLLSELDQVVSSEEEGGGEEEG